MKDQVKIKEVKYLGRIEYHLVLPDNFELSWWYFHKAFRQMDGENEKDQKLINNFYKAYAELPEKYLKWAERNLLELSKIK